MKFLKFSPVALFVVLVIAAISPRQMCGQVNLGAVKGETQDAQHAVVPHAQLTLKNEATGVVATTVSGPTGEFSFLDVAPGTYTLTTVAQGFGTVAQEHVTVGVGSTLALTVTLQVGQVQQTLTVNANGAELETQTSDIGLSISPEEIKDLPVSLSGDMRNPLNFVILTPGVSGSEPGATPDYRLNVAGSPSYGDEVYIDGVPMMNTTEPGNISNNHPPIDAISQFKLITSNQSAQYGLDEGTVSFAFKSGTNAYHGSGFDYLQNSALDAAGYVADELHEPKPPLKQNEFGGTFGGPVRIPRLYNGRDKTFFFVDYTGFKYRPSAYNSTLTTFPAQFAQGNFSQALGAQLTDPANGDLVVDPAGRPVYSGEIYNPATPHYVTGPDGKSYEVRDPFGPGSAPTNVIPAGTAGLSTVSQAILPLFPTAINNAPNDNYLRLETSAIDEHRLVIKIDEHISEKHTLSGSVFTGGYSNTNNGTLNLYDASDFTAPTVQLRLQYNYVHSPTMFNNFNVGYIRDKGFTGPLEAGPNPGPGFGISGFPAYPAGTPLAGFAIGTVQNELGGADASSDTEGRFYVSDNVTMIRGSHSITVGGEGRYLQRGETGFPNGAFTFEPTETALNGTGFDAGTNTAVSIPAGTGAPAASFLFGGVNYINITYPATPSYRWSQGAVFVQDDWRATQHLTLNLGVRYDIQLPRSEAHGNISTMDPTLPNPSAGGIPGAFQFYGPGNNSLGQPRAGTNRIGTIDYRGFQPRIGFAYSPTWGRDSVIRGGFAVSRPIGNDNSESDISGAQYTSGFSNLAMLDQPEDYIGSPAYDWDNTYPSSGVAGISLNPGMQVGDGNPPMIHPTSGIPPVQFYWTAQIEHKLSSSIVATVGYVGMHTYHLGLWAKPNETDYKTVIPKYTPAAQADGMPLNEWLELPITDSRIQAAGITSPWPGFASVFGSAATAAQALRPWPQYGDVDNPLDPIGSVSYNGLQTSVQKHFSQGLTALLAWTFSKTIGDVDSNSGPSAAGENSIYSGGYQQDFYNQPSERSVTSSDVPHVVSLSYTYELPFGPKKKYLNHGGVVGRAVGGWSVSGIQQYQSGRPIHIEYDAFGSDNPFFAGGDGYAFRVNVVPGQPLKNPAYNSKCSGPVQSTPGRQPCQFYINPAAFTMPPAATFGDAPNFFSALRLPRYSDEDLSVSKRTTIFENLDLQFQANFFNAFNRTVFSDGGNSQTYIINAAPPDLTAASLANSNTVFGIMAAQQNGPRIIQFGLKFEF
jgi:hypothetical protein